MQRAEPHDTFFASGRHRTFLPGEALEHETSVMHAKVARRLVSVHLATLTLRYSGMIFAQCYPRFRRFDCKVFLADALEHFGASCAQCIVEGAHVAIDTDGLPVPEMIGFAGLYGFEFRV